MITKENLEAILTTAIKEAKRQVLTIEDNLGKYHNLLSKAFVAAVGEQFSTLYTSSNEKICHRGWDASKQHGISGEWMLDVAVVKRKQLPNGVWYINQVLVALESELDPGTKAFVDDFSKLLVVQAPIRVYVNGVKAKLQKTKYMSERTILVEDILHVEQKTEPLFLCFVDHPSLWMNGNDPFVHVELLPATV